MRVCLKGQVLTKEVLGHQKYHKKELVIIQNLNQNVEKRPMSYGKIVKSQGIMVGSRGSRRRHKENDQPSMIAIRMVNKGTIEMQNIEKKKMLMVVKALPTRKVFEK